MAGEEGNTMVWFIPEELDKVKEGLTRQVAWVTNSTDQVKMVTAVMEKSVSSGNR